MRKALIVGIDHYKFSPSLYGCANDAVSVKNVLERHADEDAAPNFAVKLMLGTGPTEMVARLTLWDQIQALFSGDAEIALLYFAGHGHVEPTGGYLLAGDSRAGMDGVSLHDVLSFATQSRAHNRMIILDSCHSGIAASTPAPAAGVETREGTTILTSSTAEQYATEQNKSGLFTKLLVDALSGAGANLVGEVTPGSIYAHIDQSLGPWEQRPVFKTHVKGFVSLRKVQPSITLAWLRKLAEFFPQPDAEFRLDPTFEPERDHPSEDLPPPDPENTQKFAILQKCARVNLVVPVGAPHMWHAAMWSKSCRLTALGQHYRRLVERERL